MHVLKRWATWPQGIRWLVGIAAGILLLAILWALFVPGSSWLASHDVGSVRGPLYETALDNARGRLLTLVAGLFAAGALAFTALNFTLSRRTFELTEQGQVTDRFTQAIGQLGSDKIDVRIGGIYALERIARDSAKDHPTVMEVLTAFIREHSHEQWPLPDTEGRERKRRTRPDVLAVSVGEPSHEPLPPSVPVGREQKGWTRPDVQAAVTVVGRRDQAHDVPGGGLDLTGVNLTGANLIKARLAEANLSGVDFSGARLWFADLSGAELGGADLTRARLRGASLAAAYLIGAFLTGAELIQAKLTGAVLIGADLTGANLYEATLDGAKLEGAQLDGALWPKDAAVPKGWKRDAGSGRLSAVGIGAETAEGN